MKEYDYNTLYNWFVAVKLRCVWILCQTCTMQTINFKTFVSAEDKQF